MSDSPEDLVDQILGFCSATWYASDDMVYGGCPGNEGASHLCGVDRGPHRTHECQDCGAKRAA